MSLDGFGYLLVFITLVLTILEIRTRNMPIGAIAAGLWIATWRYIVSNSPKLDSSVSQILALVFIVMAIIMFFWGIITNGNDESKKHNRFGFIIKEPPPINETRRLSGTGRLVQTPEEYRETIHRKLHPREKD